MRNIVLPAALVLLTFACTSMRPVDGSREQIREQIRAGALVAPGDRILVTTDDGAEQEFRVSEVRSDGTLVGKNHEVPVTAIATLEKRERSWIKTGVLLGLVGLSIFGTSCEGEPCQGSGSFPFCCP
jgi:hypothetical protein